MNHKKILTFITCLSSIFAIGTVLLTALNQDSSGLFAQLKEPYGIVFNHENNKLTNKIDYEESVIYKNVDLLSKSRTIKFEASGVKSNEQGWQIFKNKLGYFQNIDHIIGMDAVTFTARSIATVGNIDIYYSENPIIRENKNTYHKSSIILGDDKDKTYSYDFNSYKPNYILVEASGADVSIKDCRIDINEACHNFYPTLTLLNEDDSISSVSGGGNYLENSEVSISATGNNGYKFLGWYEGNTLVSSDNPYTFKMPTSDLTLRAVFNTTVSKDQIVNFGSYPQDKVIDDKLCQELTNMAKTLPTSANSGSWVSYKYYQNNKNDTDFMWYQDIIHPNGNKYRGVYFTSYRPYWISGDGTDASTVQDNNGYLVNNVYWFKYSPIEWKVITDSGVIFANKIIDSQNYYLNGSNHKVNGELVYANNYEHSSIRDWLNTSYYETSLSDFEKLKINQVLVKNDLASTGDTTNKNICNDTNDNVFLMSKNDANTYFTNDVDRMSKCTDYAACMGCKINTTNQNSSWWLRTPNKNNYYQASQVNQNGGLTNFNVYSTMFAGVRPCMLLKK